jgi:3-hydroxyisobutyrate dehydrogenase-like beta-hydroxyacid dehydrogenase
VSTERTSDTENGVSRDAQTIGLVGLGLLGSALGSRLIEQGVVVLGFDVDSNACDRFATAGGQVAQSLPQIAGCGQIILSLPTSTISRQVIDELLPHLKSETAIIDTTTGSPTDVEAAAELLGSVGVEYLDATVGGSSNQARQGDAIIMCGASEAGFESCQATLDRLSSRVFHTGLPGSGSRMKLVTNLVLGLNRAVLAEGLAFAEAQGLDAASVLAILQAGPAASRVMDIKGQRMIERDFEPEARLRQHAKDVGLILETASNSKRKLPLAELHAELLQGLIERGLGDLDNSAIREAF